jgi:thioredoxin 1
MAQELNQSNFEAEVLQADVPVLVDFWAPWCGPCQQQLPILEGLSNLMADQPVKIGKVNVDENPELGQKYGVMSIPTLLIIKGGEVVETLIGVQQEGTLKEKLEAHM